MDFFLGIAALLVADHHAGRTVESRQAADDRLIVAVAAVAVQLVEVGEDPRDVIERVRSLRMTCNLRDLPGGKLAIDFLGQLLAFLVETVDLVRDVDRGVFVHIAKLVDLGLQIGDGLLEIEKGLFHRARLDRRKGGEAGIIAHWRRLPP